jgi:hypothetical protein
MLGLNPGGRYVDRAISQIASIPPNKLKDLGVGSFVYAALFLTEGLGPLLMDCGVIGKAASSTTFLMMP